MSEAKWMVQLQAILDCPVRQLQLPFQTWESHKDEINVHGGEVRTNECGFNRGLCGSVGMDRYGLPCKAIRMAWM